MDRHILSNSNRTLQHTKDGKTHMDICRRNFLNFLDDLIRENATKKPDYFTLDISDVSYIDKKQFLAYITEASEYEDLTANNVRERAAINEYQSVMQKYIDNRIDAVYFMYMDDIKDNHNNGYCACLTSLT